RGFVSTSSQIRRSKCHLFRRILDWREHDSTRRGPSASKYRTVCLQAWAPPVGTVDLLSEDWMTRLLCSTRITRASSLLQVAPPLCLASVLWLSWGLHLSISLNIETTGSKVPSPSLIRALAAFMPDAAWASYRLLPC